MEEQKILKARYIRGERMITFEFSWYGFAIALVLLVFQLVYLIIDFNLRNKGARE